MLLFYRCSGDKRSIPNCKEWCVIVGFQSSKVLQGMLEYDMYSRNSLWRVAQVYWNADNHDPYRGDVLVSWKLWKTVFSVMAVGWNGTVELDGQSFHNTNILRAVLFSAVACYW